MTRVCFFNTMRSWGGGEKWHYEAAEYLASRGHDVSFIAHPSGELRKRLTGRSIKVVPLAVSNASWLNPLKIIRLALTFRAGNIQTVVFNSSSDVKMGAPAAVMAGVPAIVYRRGIAVPVKNTAFNRYLYGRLVTHFLANSQATAQELFRHLPVPHSSSRTKTIYNGIDLAQFTGAAAPDPRSDPHLIIGTAGRLETEKGHHHLLAVARRLKENQLRFELRIAGEGSLKQQMQKEIQETGLAGAVTLCGFVSDMPGFMRSLDVFVFPSKWEGFGYASAEAMGAGLPVVAFDVLSNREVVEHAQTGFLVPPGNLDEFAKRVAQLGNDPGLRGRMGRKGSHRVAMMFNKSEQLPKIEDYLCREVLAYPAAELD
jgi:glycosyltransferase involved in cell wall biosynthesis